MGRGVNQIVLEQKPPEYSWGDTLPIFRTADARICNLECVLSRERLGRNSAKLFISAQRQKPLLDDR